MAHREASFPTVLATLAFTLFAETNAIARTRLLEKAPNEASLPEPLQTSMAALSRIVDERHRLTGNKNVVYTVITGGYIEPCYIDKAAREESIDMLLFTDNISSIIKHSTSIKGWDIVEIPHVDLAGEDFQMLSRILKMMPSDFLKSYETTLYIDGNVEVCAPLADLFDLVGHRSDDRAPEDDASESRSPELAVYSFNRNVDEEAEWVAAYAVKEHWMSEVEARIRVGVQAKRYSRQYPELMDRTPGTYYGKVILRRMTKRVKAFGRIWFGEFSSGVRRDQLSFRYSTLEANLSVKVLERSCHDTCKPYNDPGFAKWFVKHKEVKHKVAVR